MPQCVGPLRCEFIFIISMIIFIIYEGHFYVRKTGLYLYKYRIHGTICYIF